jgi:hypothetical protein
VVWSGLHPWLNRLGFFSMFAANPTMWFTRSWPLRWSGRNADVRMRRVLSSDTARGHTENRSMVLRLTGSPCRVAVDAPLADRVLVCNKTPISARFVDCQGPLPCVENSTTLSKLLLYLSVPLQCRGGLGVVRERCCMVYTCAEGAQRSAAAPRCSTLPSCTASRTFRGSMLRASGSVVLFVCTLLRDAFRSRSC